MFAGMSKNPNSKIWNRLEWIAYEGWTKLDKLVENYRKYDEESIDYWISHYVWDNLLSWE
jgi:hypothetical protein